MIQIPKWNTDLIPLIDHEASKGGKRQSIKFGLPLLSNALEGFEKGELILITAPPGEGKTQLGRTLALDFVKQGMNVLFCSYELSLSQLKNLFELSGLNETDNKRLLLAPKEHTERDILFVEKLMEANKENSIDCLVIDDFHALEENYAFQQRDTGASFLRAIAGKLKDMALKQNCVVITMAHLRKDAIRQKNNSIGDIAYSGGMAQVSDTIFAIRQEPKDMAIIEIIKSRWSGKKIKVKVSSVNKIFKEVDLYVDQTPAERVNNLYNNL